MDLGLTGRVAIVTGASRGIGRAVALPEAGAGLHEMQCGRSEAGRGGGREERIPTIDALATLVDLQIESLGACASPTPTLRAPGSLSKKPLVLKPKRSMSVRFDVPIGCANDPAKSPKGESSAHDYGFVAQLGAFGGADSQPLVDGISRRRDVWPAAGSAISRVIVGSTTAPCMRILPSPINAVPY